MYQIINADKRRSRVPILLTFRPREPTGRHAGEIQGDGCRSKKCINIVDKVSRLMCAMVSFRLSPTMRGTIAWRTPRLRRTHTFLGRPGIDTFGVEDNTRKTMLDKSAHKNLSKACRPRPLYPCDQIEHTKRGSLDMKRLTCRRPAKPEGIP